MKKFLLLLIAVGFLFTVTIGCKSSNQPSNVDGILTDNADGMLTDNANGILTDDIEGEMEGELFRIVLKGLASGIAGSAGSDVYGVFMRFAGWGDDSDAEQEETLKNIDSTLLKISDELISIENELKVILTELIIIEDEIKNDVNWPRHAIDNIASATQSMQLLAVNKKPGEVDRAKILKLADEITPYENMPQQVITIYNGFKGNDTPLLTNYVNEVIENLNVYDHSLLKNAYQGFEYFTAELMNNQIMGVNLMVEAYKAQDDNISAQNYLDCYKHNLPNNGEFICNLLNLQLSDMQYTYSFKYNFLNMVLRNAPLYYGQILPSSAISIIKRAEFYRMLLTGIDEDKFGLRFFHISTMDTPIAPDILYASSTDSDDYTCESVPYQVVGRPYDVWIEGYVKPNSTYRVVEYNCGSVPVGTYGLSTEESPSSIKLDSINVSNYDANYTQTDDGNFTYGLGIYADFISNRFVESWPHWSSHHKIVDNTKTIGSANKWPIGIEYHVIDGGSNSVGSNDLRGNFKYSGSNDREMTVDYSAEFDLYVAAVRYWIGVHPNVTVGYSTGVHNSTEDKSECHHTYQMTVTDDYSKPINIKSEHRNVNHSCSFTAKPNNKYYVYFKTFISGGPGDAWVNENSKAYSKVKKVNRVYIKFDE